MAINASPWAAGRIYDPYEGVYIGIGIMWLWLVDSIKPTFTDWVGAILCLLGMAIIMIGAKHTWLTIILSLVIPKKIGITC